MSPEFKTVPFAFKADAARRLSGLGAVFNNIDAGGDIIAPGAFKQDIASFIECGFIGGLNHNWDEPIASIESASEGERGLDFRSMPLVDTKEGERVIKLITGEKPVVKDLSIGYRVLGHKYLEDADEVAEYWAEKGYEPSEQDKARSQYGARLLTRIKVMEVSPCTIGMNDRAKITGTKAESASFAEHSHKVVATVGESKEEVEAFLDRCNSRIEARHKDGRELSVSNKQAIREARDRHVALCEQHKSLCDRLTALLEEPAKATGAEPKEEPKFDVAAIAASYSRVMLATTLGLDN